jgi:hypothetical protein
VDWEQVRTVVSEKRPNAVDRPARKWIGEEKRFVRVECHAANERYNEVSLTLTHDRPA